MTWNLEPPPGFQGLHPDKPVTLYRRHLPHWRQPGATYFVTFRLADSLPRDKLRELQSLREDWERRNPDPRTSQQWSLYWKQTFRRVDRWLDQGAGRCYLRDPQASKIVSDALHHFDGNRYEIGCFVVMPNHVHLIVRPYDEHDSALARITHSWKRFTSRRINSLFGTSGRLWQPESFDRIVRDEDHLWRVIQYIGRNPSKSALGREECQLWISPAWQRLGWDFANA